MSPDTSAQLEELIKQLLLCFGWLIFIGGNVFTVLKDYPPILPDPKNPAQTRFDKIREWTLYHFVYFVCSKCNQWFGVSILLTDPGARDNIVSLIANFGDNGHSTNAQQLRDEFNTVKDTIESNMNSN